MIRIGGCRMLKIILSAISVFISTNIDDLFTLTIIFSQLSLASEKRQVYAGKFVGIGFLTGVNILIAYTINFIPEDWIIGLLGIIPIIMGIRLAIVGEEHEEQEEVIEIIENKENFELFWTITLLTVSAGGNNFGVYIPYFSTLDWSQISIVLIVFAIGIILLVEISQALSNISFISSAVAKYERIFLPILFNAIGIYILFENGTLSVLYNLLF